MIRLQAVVVSLVLLAFSAVACSEPNPVQAEYIPEDCECAEEGASAEADQADEPALQMAGFSFASSEATDEDEGAEPAVWTEAEGPESDDATPAEGDDAKKSSAKKDSNGLSGQLNLNDASMNQLMLLPGVGPALAERIVSYREKREFAKTSHLKRVRGIGDATFAKMSKYLRVSGPTTLSE